MPKNLSATAAEENNAQDGKKVLKLFSVKDLFLYAALLVLTALLFSAVFATRTREGIDRIVAESNGKIAAEISLNNGTVTVGSQFSALVSVEKVGALSIITVYTDENKTGYNVITADFSQKTARVSDSDCSLRKDCVHTVEIRKAGDMIVCLPHGLVVRAVSDETPQPSSGGARI